MPTNQLKVMTSDVAFVRFAVLPADTVRRLSCGEEDLVREVAALMADPYVREAVWLASPALLARYDHVSSTGCEIDVDVIAAVAKYLIRMSYRSTPFGTFAGVGTVAVAGCGSVVAPVRRELYRHVQASTAAVSLIASRLLRQMHDNPDLPFYPNDTLSIRCGRASWVAYSLNRKGKRIYRNEMVEVDKYLSHVLELARQGLSLTTLARAATDSYPEVSEGQFAEFLAELVDAQLLCCDGLLDLTSDDLLDSMANSFVEAGIHGKKIADAQSKVSCLSGEMALSVPSSYDAAMSSLADLQGPGAERSDLPVKVDLYARKSLGAVSSRVVKSVEEAIAMFAVFSEKNNGLTKFAANFVARYGDLEVPLLDIASELSGLGYVERSSSAPSILRFLGASSVTRSRDSTAATGISNVVDKLISDSTQEYIHLRPGPESYVGLSQNSLDAQVVSWLSVWKSNAGELIEIRSVGAQRAGRVMGRFSYQLPELRSALARDGMPHSKSDALPAEIVHLPEDDLGSVCARPVLSAVEIGIRAGPSKNVLRVNLADLVILVRDGRVLVKSRSLGRFLSLRMSNAHAVDRPGSLPLYRFLSSIATQGQAVSIPTLRDRFPTAPYVPGMRFKDIILSRPTWYIKPERIDDVAKLKGDQLLQAWRTLSDDFSMPHEVALVQGDRVIPFDTRVGWMLTELIRHLKRAEKSILTTTSPLGLQPAIMAADGPRAHELQLVHRLVGQGRPHDSECHADIDSAVKVLGRGWIYVKIYSSAQSASYVLDALAKFAAEKQLELFFVRYRDDKGFHLRVRLRTSKGKVSLEVVGSLVEALDALRREFIIQEISVDSYVRELQRYGGDALLSKIEDLWVCESESLMRQSDRLDDQGGDYWKCVAASMDRLMISLGYRSLESRLKFATRAAADFHAEIRFSKNDRKRIGRLFATAGSRLLEGAISFDGVDTQWCEALAPESLTDQIASDLAMQSEGRRYSISWAIIHMRVNRMFVQDHRYQEAVVWELLKRSYVAFVKRRATDNESSTAVCHA
ncbi:hypothetical protein TEP_18230 [Stenotrophomonas sp. TEPEL]|uniref:lantibiotic dehydratase n=1 Tax=Stenotrophomonas sp. TEPEL TaxID=2283801 RepID=UPI0010DD9A83|nr:lantibiotic dehydratase [Stenotrophomonas sp. TEPEL]TDB35424.1 hypothetical protein TEP_18230 [Stenotrophomonas sp. TEPEL]